jgi:hypothetical protein
MLPIQAAAVRARCERSSVDPCRVTFDTTGDLGSVMRILLVGVRWGRVIGWVCKPKVTGSSPVRSTSSDIAQTSGARSRYVALLVHGAYHGCWPALHDVDDRVARVDVEAGGGEECRADISGEE